MKNAHSKNLMAQLRDAGVTITLIENDRIEVRPSERLDDQLRALIRENKKELIASLFAANQPHIKLTGTRRPPDLSPKLLAASLALDDRLVSAGYSLETLDDHQVPQPDHTVEMPKDNPPPRKKILDHFHVDSAWRILSREYYAHHARCTQCQAAGQRYGVRCDIGLELLKRAHG